MSSACTCACLRRRRVSLGATACSDEAGRDSDQHRARTDRRRLRPARTGETCTSGGDSNGCFLTFSTLGPRIVTATYNGNNSLNGSTSPGVLVLAIDFSISASPTSQSVSGRKATYKVTVTGQGQFAGPVVMGCVGGPTGTTCAMSPASVALSGPTADAKATVTVPAGAAPGTYTMTFSGTFGGVTRLAGAKLIVK